MKRIGARKTRSASCPQRRAFTLMEVLVAIALVLALVGAMSWFLHDMMAGREQIDEELARRQAASLIIDRLEQDLLTCIAGDGRTAGVRGTETELTVLMRSVPARLAARRSAAADGFDEAGGALDEREDHPSSLALLDLEAAVYRYDSRRGVLAMGRGLPAGRSASTPGVNAMPTALAGVLGAVRFRYHDGSGWRERYDSARDGGLPTAIEVAVWYEPVGDRAGMVEGFAPPMEMFEDGPGEDVLSDPEAFDDWIDDADGEADVSREPPQRPSRTPDRVRIIAVIDPSGEEPGLDKDAGLGEGALDDGGVAR